MRHLSRYYKTTATTSHGLNYFRHVIHTLHTNTCKNIAKLMNHPSVIIYICHMAGSMKHSVRLEITGNGLLV